MTSPSALADAHKARAQRLARSAADRLQERWALVDASDMSGSWATLLPGAVEVLAAAQALAVLQAEEYVARATGEAGPRLNATAWAGTAADGRSLVTLLALPVIRTKRAIAAGQSVRDALGRGLAQLVSMASTEVADAGRTATGVGITARPRVRGSVRVVTAPACGRCLVLAGRVYRWSEGFQRHPHCDCTMAPAMSDQGREAPEPRQLFEQMTPEQQNRALGSAKDAQAIRDGADIGRLVNAQRGMYTAAGRKLTTEGVKLRQGGVRLRPEQIYREAVGDRAEAIRLLRRFGYIT